MGTFTITSSKLNSQYTYSNTSIVVTGNYVVDATSGNVLQSVQGSCYRQNQDGEMGEYFGDFNGFMRDGEIKYSLSEMTRRDSNLVWDAIDEIEQNIIGQNVEE